MTHIADEFGNVNCLYCINCTNCTNCVGCNNCDNCEDCIKCNDCTICFDCEECRNCRECQFCVKCTDCSNTIFSEGVVFENHSSGQKDYQLFDNEHIVFPSKGRCQYSDKIESFFLVKGLTPYKRIPKNTDYKKKSSFELFSEKDFNIDGDELASLIISQGPQIAWNIRGNYKRYWITTGKFKANFTLEALSIFLIMDKLSISKTDIKEYTRSSTPIHDIEEFYREFVFSFTLSDLSRLL